MIDGVRIERITRLKDRVVKDFDHGDWAMLAIYLGDKGKIIDAHSRLLRSFSWGDDDYPACVAEVLSQLISNDESVIDLVESMLDDKQGNAGIDSRNDVVSELVLDISSAKDLDITLASAMMPFHASFVDVREAMRSACSNCGLKLKAADETCENLILIQDIFDLITRSCIVIVDFTGKNPNVMYETGMAHALGKEVIPVTQDISDVPFDLKHHMLSTTTTHLTHMRTEDIRRYLSNYEQTSHCSKASIDNIRRILSSLFSWLEDEDYILKSPIRRIRKIKSARTVKDTYSDETLEKMRDGAKTLRDLALIDLLASTGMRVGELVKLDIADVDFERRECIVLGKGNKERPVYFDARTKIHLRNYLDSRSDHCPALFVTLCKPNNRLQISGVEARLRNLGRELSLDRVHPHKFRRTLATKAIDKGMPIEQVQRLLGHAKIDTTLMYAMVDQSNVKAAHRRYIA